MTNVQAQVPAPRPAYNPLPFALAILGCALAAFGLGASMQSSGAAVAAALPLAAGGWAALHYGYSRARRPGLAAPYLAALALTAVALAVAGEGSWREWGAQGGSKSVVAKAGDKASPASATAFAPSADPSAAAKVVDSYFADIRTGAQAYIGELDAAGYLAAVSGSTLAAPGGINAAPDRIRQGREITARHRETALARTDKAIAAVKALPVRSEEESLLVQDLTAELETVREKRVEYFDGLAALSDGIEGMAKVLMRAQGHWRYDSGQSTVLFEADADDTAYAEAKASHDAASSELDRVQSALNRSAEALKTLAARYGT